MQLKSSQSKESLKKNKRGRRVLIIFVCVFVLYIVAQFFNTIMSGISTEVAVYGSAEDSILADGIIVKKETLVTSNNTGVINYLVRDGEKVAIGSKIASYYSSREQISAINTVNVLDKQIAAYKAMNSNLALGSSDVVSNDMLIEKNIRQIIDNNQKGDFHSSYDLKTTITMLINRRRVLQGEVANFDDELAALYQKRMQAAAVVGSSANDIYTSSSGYFLKSADGFENALSNTVLSSYDVSAVNDILNTKPQTVPQNVIGKVVNDFSFYFCAIVSKESSERMQVGQLVDLSFPTVEGNVPAEVAYISKVSDGKCVVSFRCDYMAKCLTLARKQKAGIVLKTYSGLKIRQSAVRMVDNKMGVYILAGTQARFKTIDPIFSKDGYYIVKQDFNNSASLLLYDTVIIKGSNLYDGKIVK